MPFVLDTNHLSAVVKPVSQLRETIYRRYRAGHRFATCWPVLCELETGILDTRHPEKCRRMLRDVLAVVRVWPFDWHIVHLFGLTDRNLQRRGRALSQVDIMLAAFAQHYGATILTIDKDFKALPAIKTENWL